MKQLVTDITLMTLFIVLMATLLIIQFFTFLISIILSPIMLINILKTRLSFIGLDINSQAELKKLSKISWAIKYCQKQENRDAAIWHCEEMLERYHDLAGPKPHDCCMCRQAIINQKVICLKLNISPWRINWVCSQTN